MSSRRRSAAAEMRSASTLLKLKQSSSAPEPRRIASAYAFREMVWRYWKENGRHNLPWRKTDDPYRILVSEVMLQQTQVDRVIPKYKEFLRKFPTIRHLARSDLASVLRVWNGLGYNRRAKYLRDAAIAIVERHKGYVPALYAELIELPGAGDYTARAIRVFAFNEPDVFVETNIRTSFIHHFHTQILKDLSIRDSELLPLVREVAKGQDPREWHWALMDYGAYLKRSGIRDNHQSAHYVKQSKFEGSLRQVRGTILRSLSEGEDISGLRNPNITMWKEALASLARDGLVINQRGRWRIS